MGYRLKVDEPVADGVKRVVLEEIDKATTMLRQNGDKRDHDQDDGIHEARKSFKKIRAVLRLVRPSLGAAYGRENAWFRDVARELSGLRDAQAVLESLEKLRKACPEQTDQALFADIRTALARRRTAAEDHDTDLAKTVERVCADLDDVRQRIEAWDLGRAGFAAIGPGLRRTYRRGRQARAITRRSPSDEAFHEWRKRVKYHWYHVRLLQDLWPGMLKPYRASLKEMSTILGDDHDLVVLKQAVAASDSVARDSTACATFTALVDRRQEQLRAAAHPLGERIYADKPKCLHGQFQSYWQTWRGDT